MFAPKLLQKLFILLNLILCINTHLEAYSKDLCAPGSELKGKLCEEIKEVIFNNKQCKMKTLYKAGRLQRENRDEFISCEDAYYVRSFFNGKLRSESVHKKCRNGDFPDTWGVCEEKKYQTYNGEACSLISKYRLNSYEDRTESIVCKNILYIQNEYKNNKLSIQKEFDSKKHLIRETRFKNNKKDGEEVLFCQNSDHSQSFQITHYVNGLKNGQEITYNCSTSLRIPLLESTYKNGKKEGIEKEYYKRFESQIKLKREVMYKNGKKEGIEKEYFYTRGLKPYNAIKIETPYKLGEKNGKELEYAENGDLIREVVYKNGKKEGVEKEYCGSQICGKTPYKNGNKDGIARTFDSDGQLLSQIPYKDDKKNGVEIQYFPSTKLVEKTIPYKDDKKNGEEIQYYINGKVKSKINYLDGKKHKTTTLFAENGKKIHVINFQNDLKEGKEIMYHKNGKIKIEVSYKNDQKNGYEKLYSTKGYLVQEIQWKDGRKNGLEQAWKNGKKFYSIQFQDGEAISVSGICGNGKKIGNGHLHIINQYGTSEINNEICN